MLRDDSYWEAADAAWIASSGGAGLERPLYRMPVGFGPAASQRNHPTDKAHFVTPGKSPTFRVTAATEAEALGKLLPPGVEVRGEPRFQVVFTHVQEAYWLAGRDYTSLTVRVPVTVTRGESPVDANYYAVKWDSLADNVLTARDDIGWPTLWADVSAPIRLGTDGYSVHASWLGYRFFDMELTSLGESEEIERDDSMVQVTYKYVPVGYGPGADLSKLIVNDLSVYWAKSASVSRATTGRQKTVVLARRGDGSFRFHRARWEDMPTQFHVVNALADLPVLAVTRAEAMDSPYM
ncbi:MAG: acetoacetate decarboxylase family protein [Acidimicrobiia bacterium]